MAALELPELTASKWALREGLALETAGAVRNSTATDNDLGAIDPDPVGHLASGLSLSPHYEILSNRTRDDALVSPGA